MKDLKVNIPSLCHEDWRKMKLGNEGRYCTSCSKVVVDFTHMSGEEIKSYFMSRKGQETCGHFRASQVSKQSVKDQVAGRIKSKGGLVSRSLRAALLILTGFALTIAGCFPGRHVRGKVKHPVDEGNVETPRLMGKVYVPRQ